MKGFSEAQYAYDNQEPDSEKEYPLTEDQRKALRILADLMGQRGITDLHVRSYSGRWTCRAQSPDSDVETVSKETSVALETALALVPE